MDNVEHGDDLGPLDKPDTPDGPDLPGDLEQRLAAVRQNREALNQLIADYLPFIRGQAASARPASLEFEDAQSIAMMVFANCALQYESGRGGFLSFARTCIRNRFIDETRKAVKNCAVVSLGDEEQAAAAEQAASLLQYDREQERRRLCEEIDEVSKRLAPFGVTFSQLPDVCPKHAKARRQCLAIAEYVAGTEDLRRRLLDTGRLAQNELAQRFRLSVKTIEKHRKYIVALAILSMGDYPCIQAFLPQ